uniref:Islet cell autoantigen 1-like n=1 Tax=Cyprinus carpio TaxID=7962 RepID=A0A8C1Y612_CYPCA
MDSYGFSSDMFSGRAVLGEDSSVMARMQKKFWKTKQVLIKATGKKEDEHVVASDADLDAKLEFFRSVQSTCTELLKVIEKYQQRITHLSQEENELGLFLRFQAEHDKTKAGSMMDATSKALCFNMCICPYWEKTAHVMSGIHEAFKGYVPYQFTTLKELRDPLDQIVSTQTAENSKDEEKKTHPDNLVSLEDEQLGESSDMVSTRAVDGQSRGSDSSLCASLDSALNEQLGPIGGDSTDDDLLLLTPEPGPTPSLIPTLTPTLHPSMSVMQPQILQEVSKPPAIQWGVVGRDLLSEVKEEEGERGDLAFLQDLLSPGAAGGNSEFSKAWQDAFGCFEAPPAPVNAPLQEAETANTPTGFLPSHLLDHSLSATGWATPPMFQAPPLQPPSSGGQPTQNSPHSSASAPKGSSRDMSAWFNLFADLDPLSNPDAIGRSDQEFLNA